MTSETRSKAVRRVLWWTLVLNIAVAVAKLVYGYASHALSIRADGFHSLTDGGNNVVGLVSLWLASRPPDEEHPYGHHKFETLAAALVGASLLAVAYDVLSGAAARLGGGAAPLPQIDAAAFVVLGVTLIINVGVARFEHREAKRLQSAFLESDATHTQADVLVTLGVVVATALVKFGYVIADVVAAVVVAGFVGWAGLRVLWQNVSLLSDVAQLDPKEVEAVVLTVSHVAGTHKIRSRGAPNAVFVDLHIQIAPDLDVIRAHRVTHDVIDAIKGGFANVADVVVHTEPHDPQHKNRSRKQSQEN